MKPLPTLADVARLSGVSTATVSRVLNEPARVKAETRARVEAAVSALSYTPHFGGRALASSRTHTVGAVIPTMENAIFARGLQAMQEELAEAGITLLVATSNYDAMREAAQITALIGRGVDGLILIGEARAPEVYAMLDRREVPLVLVWSWHPDSPRICVGFDNAVAARAMAARVCDMGHRQIAMIAGITRFNDRAAGRVEGVQAELAARGIPLRPEALIEAEYSLDGGAQAAARLLALSRRPTAIVCGNDVLAAGAMLAIREAGLRVPQDVSVTGFDDIELARLLDPPLDTVHVPHRRMGRAAARTLLRLCAGETGVTGTRMDVELVARASLCPPPGG